MHTRMGVNIVRRMMKLVALTLVLLVTGCSKSEETREPSVYAAAVAGFDSIIATNLFVRITTDKEWSDLYFKHRQRDKLKDTPTPELDFKKEMLIGIFFQVATNSSGINLYKAFENTNAVEVYFREYSNFSTRIEDGYRPYILVWMKKSPKPVNIYQSVPGTEFSNNEQWKIVATIEDDD